MTVATKLACSAAAGFLTLAVTHFWRDFPLRLALISGIAVSVLAYSTLQASARLANLYRRDGSPYRRDDEP